MSDGGLQEQVETLQYVNLACWPRIGILCHHQGDWAGPAMLGYITCGPFMVM